MKYIIENSNKGKFATRFLLYIGLLLFGLLIGSLGSIAATALTGNNIIGLKIGQAISSTMTFIMPPLLLYLFTRDNALKQIGFSRPNNYTSLFVGMAIMFISIPLIGQLTTWNGNLHLPNAFASIESLMKSMEERAELLTKQMLDVHSFGGWLCNLVIIALIPAIGEELTFRGVLQQSLTKTCKSPHVAIILCAAIFSAIHFQFYGFLPRMVLGAFLGYLFFTTKSLWTCIIMHFLNNGTAVTMYYLNNIGAIKVDVDSVGADCNIFVVTLSAILCGLAIAWTWRKMRITEPINSQRIP